MKIVFLEPLGICKSEINLLTQNLKEKGHTIKIYPDRTEDEKELIKRAHLADIIVISNIPLKKNFLESCPNLKMISVGFTGLDHIDLKTCKERNIFVKNAAGYATEAVAELAIGMIISLYRKIIGGDSVTRCGGTREDFIGTELAGKTVGIIGLGDIGEKLAQLSMVFGCKVLAYNRSPKKIKGIKIVDKEKLLKKADIISIHLPLTEETKDFISLNEFRLMKPSAILINTARGAIVNKDDLLKALEKGLIAGAAVDVYEKEPPLPKNYELFNAPNLIMLPHMGYATQEAFQRRIKIVIKNIEKWLQKQ